jgi:thymidylate synthase
MATITIESLQLEYRKVLDYVYKHAVINQPRGLKTYEVSPLTLEITMPVWPQLPVNTGRGVSLDIAAIEAIQLISGTASEDLLLKIAPQFRQYTDVKGSGDDGDPMVRRFHGNYGRRMSVNFNHQCNTMEWHHSWLECAVDKIKNDRDTRQAVITIWENNLDNGIAGAKDYPCTVALMFHVHNGRLDMHTTMRSNDAWKGLPYDVFQFTQAQHTVANMLCIPMGRYFHNVMSMHLYDEDSKRISSVRDRGFFANTILPQGFTSVKDAHDILAGRERYDHEPQTHRWYIERLSRYLTEEKTSE